MPRSRKPCYLRRCALCRAVSVNAVGAIAQEATRQYNRYLRRAKEEDLSDMAKRNFIYQSGQVHYRTLTCDCEL